MPAFALGLFVAFQPIPGHMLIAALLALALTVHIPIAAITTLVCNPLTMGPMFFLAYRVGLKLLGERAQPFAFELSLDWLTGKFLAVWQPLLLGCLLLGSLAALIGYVSLDLLWRASLADYLAAKRNRNPDRNDPGAR